MKYRIEERYFFDGRSEFLPQYQKEEKDLWGYFIHQFDHKEYGRIFIPIKFNTYKEALDIINKDKEGLSDPLTILYHEIKDIK